MEILYGKNELLSSVVSSMGREGHRRETERHELPREALRALIGGRVRHMSWWSSIGGPLRK